MDNEKKEVMWDGEITHMRAYPYCLTGKEVRRLFNHRMPFWLLNLQAMWFGFKRWVMRRKK